MTSEYANIPPSTEDRMFIVEATVRPPIEGDPEAALVTIQPDAMQACKRFEVHFAMMDRTVVDDPVATPIEDHPEFQETELP